MWNQVDFIFTYVTYCQFLLHFPDIQLCELEENVILPALSNLTMVAFIQGSYTLTMKIVDGSNQELSCITFGFSISLAAVAESIAVAAN